MACTVMPLKNQEEISYRIKCVTVENEKVFGNVLITRENRRDDLCIDGCQFSSIHKKRRNNIIHKLLEGPDFMELNRSKPKRRISLIPPRIIRTSTKRSKSVGDSFHAFSYEDAIISSKSEVIKKPKIYPSPLPNPPAKEEAVVTSLVDQLLLDIYGLPAGEKRRSESDSTTSSVKERPQHQYLQKTRLLLKNIHELQVLVYRLREHINHTGGLLVRQLRRKDYLMIKREKQCDIITAHLQAYSEKRFEDTKMRFSLTPQPGESGFIQWLDAMKMVARLQGGIPPEFRKKLWLTLAERHLEQRGVDWKQAEKICFNEWSNPDDEELGIQIVKDLHRTGCSLFCGAAGRDNQAVLRRVLLGFARWNKSVGYCQGLNVLAALVLQVVDRAESAAVKVMIFLIEGVLPEGYFADNLRGLSIDMAVFRDLLRARLPKLSKHLETLQSDAKDKATGSSYEPPLTNVFTMQWFLTLFCHCLPQEAVLRVWDLIFLEGDEILLRTALAIWEGLSERIITVTSADEFYSIMGVLTREMLEFTDTNNLIKNIVSMGPLEGVTDLREKHRYNITPWARKLSDDDDSDTEEDERLAVAAAMFSMAQRLKKERLPATMGALQAMAPSSDRERLALDISTLKQQYAKLRERQRQAHIILSAACARQSMVAQPTSQAMNHLLVGKSALVSAKARTLGLPLGTSVKGRSSTAHSPRSQNRKDRQGVTLHWKDTKKLKKPDNYDFVEGSGPSLELPQESLGDLPSPKRSSADSDSDSTSTELCDEPDRLSDVDSEELTSASESYVMATDDERNSKIESSPTSERATQLLSEEKTETENSELPQEIKKLDSSLDGVEKKEGESDIVEISISKITDQIRRLSAEDDNNTLVPQASKFYDDESIDDSTSKGSFLENDKSTTDYRIDYSMDITTIRKSLEIDDFHYSSFATSAISNNKQDEVLVHENYGLREQREKDIDESEKDIVKTELQEKDSAEKEVLKEDATDFEERKMEIVNYKLDLGEITSKSEDTLMDMKRDEVEQRQMKVDEIEKPLELKQIEVKDVEEVKVETKTDIEELLANIRRGNSNISADYSALPLETSISKTTTKLDSVKIEDFYTSHNFSNNVSPSTQTFESSSEADSIMKKLTEPVKSDRFFYSKVYVVGHLPISPMTVDQKLSRLSQIPQDDNSDSKSQLLEKPSPEIDVALVDTTFSDRSTIVQIQPLSETKMSPKTPESAKSYSSGETMGPDSKPSSVAASPKSPVRTESRDFLMDKSVCSSISSDSKTLVLRSMDSDSGTKDNSLLDRKKASYEKSSPSTPISTDSLKNKSDTSPKLVISSSSDSGSPSKMKSSERSFSSDLQSPVSANSIKYTSSYNKRGQDTISGSPLDLSAATSPFYPIAHPNQKTPSPYSVNNRRRCSIDSVETSPEQKSSSSKESGKYLGYQSKFDSYLKPLEPTENNSTTKKTELYIRPQFTTSKENLTLSAIGSQDKGNFDLYQSSGSNDYYRASKELIDDSIDNLDDPLSEKDTVPNLPQEKLDKHYLNYNYRHRDRSRQLERSSSSLERRFAELKSSISTDEFSTSIAKKRSSDILEDIKHLEAKAFSDGSSDPGMLTKKTSYMWEDLKNLEARRQDTFSDSASTFSKRRLEIPDISVTGEGRKSYIVHPKINIDENSDSILNTIARNKDNGDSDDGRESKLGVWTKVKPRKKGNNGRRNSDRALKIIQENSAILHKILACQAKKRLPDLEEISKEITISPINEEISKIFSPILEKMGLNEHEINEELARINFKDFDNMTATSVSEFDAKINDELSKLSLIDDNEQIDHFGVDEIMSHEYLDTREALIDRKINEELSKLLANYESTSPSSVPNLDKGSSSQTMSEMEGLDISSISTNAFPYKSSNDSIETRSELGSTHEPVITADKYQEFTENVLPYRVSKYAKEIMSPKSDIDIYRELEKLDKISSAHVLPKPSPDLPQKEISPIQYVENTSPYSDIPSLRYSSKPTAYDTSPLKTSYHPYNAFDFKSSLSPRKSPNNPYTTVPYEKPVVDTSFDYLERKVTLSSNNYDLHLESPVLTKESLEFRVRYDDESPRQVSSEFITRQLDSRSCITTNKSNAYYSNGTSKPITPTKYLPKEERTLESTGTSFLDYSSETSDILHRKYDPLSPKDYIQPRSSDYDRHLGTISSVEPVSDIGSYLSTRHRDYHQLSPSRQYADQHFPSSINHYASKLSPGFGDESKRPVSHPEFPGKLTPGKYTDSSEQGSSCYRKSSLSLGNIGHANKLAENDYSAGTSPKTQFSPFPVRNAPRKPKELTLKLGLYSPQSSDVAQSKRS